MIALDVRAGKLCSHCNALKIERPHCTSPACDWWRCGRCGADNNAQGLNSKTTRDGHTKTGTRP